MARSGKRVRSVHLSRDARLERLRQAMADGALLHLRDAAGLLGVSEMTVRRDLAAATPPISLLGGYLFRSEAGAAWPRYALDAEGVANIQKKQAAARRAAALVKPGETVFVDCGTTTPHLFDALPEGELTVVCYALNIANAAVRRPQTQLVLLGGLYYPASATFYGSETLAQLRAIGITRAFVSAGGVDLVRGVSCSHFHEVPVKQAVIASARHVHLLVDSSKLGRLRPATFARVDAFESVITDDGISGTDRARLEQAAGRRAAPPRTRGR